MKFFKKKTERKPLEIPLKLLFVGKWIAEILFHYICVMTMCVYAVPMSIITMSKYIGLPSDAQWLDITMFIIIPSCFLIAILIFVYIKFMIVLHKRVFNKIYEKACVKYRAIDDEKNAVEDNTETQAYHHKKKKKKKS